MATETLPTASACLTPHGGAVGMPQLCPEWMGNQIFWLIVTLVAIFLILSRVALPRIAAVLADRKGTITNDLATAEEIKDKAAEAEAAYNKALADARAQAQGVIAAAKAEIRHELDAAIARADAEIAAKAVEGEKIIAGIRASALESVREVAVATARELAAAMGVKAGARAIDAAVEARLKG